VDVLVVTNVVDVEVVGSVVDVLVVANVVDVEVVGSVVDVLVVTNVVDVVVVASVVDVVVVGSVVDELVVVDVDVVVVSSVVVVVVVVVGMVGAVVVVVGSVVVVVGPAHVASVSEQASNLLKSPRKAPHALPFRHFASFFTIEPFTRPRFVSLQQTAAPGLPQIDWLSHFRISLRHGFSGISAVRSASLRVAFTHFLYLPCVCPSRVHPHCSWIMARAFSIDTLSEHFVLTQAAWLGVAQATSTSRTTAATWRKLIMRTSETGYRFHGDASMRADAA
jgi:hypothetical protein